MVSVESIRALDIQPGRLYVIRVSPDVPGVDQLARALGEHYSYLDPQPFFLFSTTDIPIVQPPAPSPGGPPD